MPNSPDTPCFAAIDLGSNSFHMLIARVHNSESSLETVERIKDMVQIARDLEPDGSLSSASRQRGLNCLKNFSRRLKQIPGITVRAAGTKALRSAPNAEIFLQQAEAILGHPIEIISGIEEAKLAYLGVTRSIAPSLQRSQPLVIDIGGASTEFIIGNNQAPTLLTSLDIGCVTYANRYFTEAAATGINADMINNTYRSTCKQLQTICDDYSKTGWDIALGGSGTLRVISDLMATHCPGGTITLKGLQHLIDDTLKAGAIRHLDDPKMRYDVMPAGLAILKAIFETLDIETLHVTESDIKEGLIYDLLS